MGGRAVTDPLGIRLEQFVFCLENHDQVGNRATGDRLHHTIDPAAWRAASALLLMLPQDVPCHDAGELHDQHRR